MHRPRKTSIGPTISHLLYILMKNYDDFTIANVIYFHNKYVTVIVLVSYTNVIKHTNNKKYNKECKNKVKIRVI